MAKAPDLRVRSFQFTVDVIAFYRMAQCSDAAARRVANQMLDAAGSIGANVEEAAAGQSRADFIAKNSIALKEARESRYWLRLLAACGPALAEKAPPLIAECSEIIAMITASINTARRNQPASPGRKTQR